MRRFMGGSTSIIRGWVDASGALLLIGVLPTLLLVEEGLLAIELIGWSCVGAVIYVLTDIALRL